MGDDVSGTISVCCIPPLGNLVKFSNSLHFHISMNLKPPVTVTVHLEMETLTLFIHPHFQTHMTNFPSTKYSESE